MLLRSLGVILAVAVGSACRAQLPPGFLDYTLADNWNVAVGLGFAPAGGGPPGGRLFVWEKGGKVWIVENGVKSGAPFIDLGEEVANWGDFGLIGFAVDPGYWDNGHVYLMYVVDYHHLKYFGTPQYDPGVDTPNHDTIGRITRYTATEASGFAAVDYESRRVLVGESATSGIPICHLSHGVGDLVFGSDGTLLASCGDGASYNLVDDGGPLSGSSNTALEDGIISAKEDVGAFRAQLVDSLSGKILRIDPATGDGVASNPFYDAGAPRAARSRVWSLGFRNPYRMSVRPGTGSGDPADGNPGVLYCGDVGWFDWEELNVVTGPGQNFGWPLFEGLESQTGYRSAAVLNMDAPNPLAGGSCPQYFEFRDLCVQDSLAPSWPNPCNASEQVPAGLARFVHRRPALDWWRNDGPARTGVYQGNDAAVVLVGAVGSPVSGSQFGGNCSTGGVWYTGTQYPEEYRGRYFHADFGAQWMKCMSFDSAERPTAVAGFIDPGARGFVAVAADPVSGDLHYVSISTSGASAVHRIAYTGGNNLPPVAVLSANLTGGPAPLPVQFIGSNSFDPEGVALRYRWDFGDGTPPAYQADPFHFYGRDLDVTALGTIVAKVFTLNPPGPTGVGNHDPEIIRDNNYPAPATQGPLLQFDTFHNGDQGNDDWIGYTFAESYEFTGLFFQEGLHSADGGWFESLSVEVLEGSTWTAVSGLNASPDYPGVNNGVTYETYEVRFNPVVGSGIRLRGNPGGSSNFISVGELRAVVYDPDAALPHCYEATLTVTDDAGATGTQHLRITSGNTAPTVTITSPAPDSTFSFWYDQAVELRATAVDAEHGAGELTCAWETIVHHNNHVHPGAPDTRCDASTILSMHSPDCHGFFYEFRVTVSDPACLSGSASVFMYPNCCKPDFNNDGFLDGIDYDLFMARFEAGLPAADYNADQFVDGIDYDQFANDFEAGCP